GLAMDATAVSISNGMIECNMSAKKHMFIAVCFGFFQGFMPIFGYYFGRIFADYLDPIDNIIVFIILCTLGIRMIFEAKQVEKNKDILSYQKIVIQGIATSIDALMIGVTFAILHTHIYDASIIITIITTIMTFIGVKIGCSFAKSMKKSACLLGAMIVILLSFKYLITGIM